MTHAHFRLDWQREAKILKPYFEGRSGVVRIHFETDEAAVDKFNHFIKEQFQDKGADGHWLSLRLDDEWSTTYTIDDQIFAIARKLEETGVRVDCRQGQSSVGDVASGNHAGGDLSIYIQNAVITNGGGAYTKAIEKHLELVCEAMRQFIEGGGHFMLVVNDMKSRDQGKIWKNIWNAGLRDAGGDGLSLVYYVGPRSEHVPHDDAPAPDVSFKLPHDIEADEARLDDVYDDIFAILRDFEGYSNEAAAAAAEAIISSNCHSVRRIHIGLSKAIMFHATRKA